MKAHNRQYAALISSDWNQCLAPCGPFDPLGFHFPHLQSDLEKAFRRYTANEISLTRTIAAIDALLPAPISKVQMDSYLDHRFETYPGVAGLMQWCYRNAILFMINTTGAMGYFQQVLANGLLPSFAALSAHPYIQFDTPTPGLQKMLTLLEISDKGPNTATAAEYFGIPADRIIVMGDSGGDGPHFQWAAGVGATLVASMAKPSLRHYCRQNDISITHLFGHTYAEAEPLNPEKEQQFDFQDLIPVIRQVAGI